MRQTRAVVLIVGLLLGAGACGNSNSDGGAATCPAKVPNNAPPGSGDPCSVEGLECSYQLGSLPSPSSCGRTIATCKGGHFYLATTNCAGSSQVCPASAPQTGAGCAVNCAAVKCTDGPCAYPRGVFCSCAFDSSQWKCTAPIAGECPDTMPDLGTACAHEGLDCDYGECTGPGWHERCSGGSWVHIHDQCPP